MSDEKPTVLTASISIFLLIFGDLALRSFGVACFIDWIGTDFVASWPEVPLPQIVGAVLSINWVVFQIPHDTAEELRENPLVRTLGWLTGRAISLAFIGAILWLVRN